jgi:hypothetical protein
MRPRMREIGEREEEDNIYYFEMAIISKEAVFSRRIFPII